MTLPALAAVLLAAVPVAFAFGSLFVVRLTRLYRVDLTTEGDR